MFRQLKRHSAECLPPPTLPVAGIDWLHEGMAVWIQWKHRCWLGLFSTPFFSTKNNMLTYYRRPLNIQSARFPLLALVYILYNRPCPPDFKDLTSQVCLAAGHQKLSSDGKPTVLFFFKVCNPAN